MKFYKSNNNMSPDNNTLRMVFVSQKGSYMQSLTERPGCGMEITEAEFNEVFDSVVQPEPEPQMSFEQAQALILAQSFGVPIDTEQETEAKAVIMQTAGISAEVSRTFLSGGKINDIRL